KELEFLSFAAGGELLISASKDGSMVIWDAETWKTEGRLAPYASPSPRSVKLAVSPDGHWLIRASRAGLIQSWKMDNSKNILNESGHWGAVTTVAFSPDGEKLATSATDSSMRIWDSKTGKELKAFPLRYLSRKRFAHPVLFTPDGKSVISDDGQVRLTNL